MMPPEDEPPSIDPPPGGAKPQQRGLLLSVLSWLIIMSPIVVYLVDFSSFGRMQHNDYYAILGDMIESEADGGGLSTDPLHWLNLKSNEHRASLPLVVYALNIMLTDGHNLGLTFFSLLLLTLQLVLLVLALPASIRASPWAQVLFGLGAALFCFTPVAAHNVAMGFSGSIWFFANVLAVAAITTLVRRAEVGQIWALWPVLVFGIAAAFSHSTHLILWPVLIAGGVFLRLSWGRLVLLGGGMAFVVALFALSYESLPYHPEMQTRHPTSLLRYAAVYLGSIFSGELATARTIGLIAIGACALVVAGCAVLSFTSKSLRFDLAPWLMVQLYGLGNALMTAVGRSGFGEAQAMSSRYGSLAAVFWIGLLTSMGVLAWRYRPSPTLARAAVAGMLLTLVAGLATAMHVRGGPVVDRFAARGARQPVAALAVVHGVPDNEIIIATVAPWPEHIWIRRPYLERTGHVPFDRPIRLRLGVRIEPELIADRLADGMAGYVDRSTQISEVFVRLGGWAYNPDAEVAEVLVLDGQGAIRGELVTGVHRPDVAKNLHRDALTAGWEGYVVTMTDEPEVEADVLEEVLDEPALNEDQSASSTGEIRVVVRFEGDPMFYPLPASIEPIVFGTPGS